MGATIMPFSGPASKPSVDVQTRDEFRQTLPRHTELLGRLPAVPSSSHQGGADKGFFERAARRLEERDGRPVRIPREPVPGSATDIDEGEPPPVAESSTSPT